MKIAKLHCFSLFYLVLGAVLQSVTVQASAKVADVASPDQSVVRTDTSFDLIGFVQAASAAQTRPAADVSSLAAGQDAPKPLDPLAALMSIGQLAEKGLKTAQFAESENADNGVKIHIFPTPDGATVNTIRDLPMITAADLQHAVSLMPASAEKEMVLSLIHDPQTIAAAMKASGLINASQMTVAGQDLQQLAGFLASAVPTDAQSIAGEDAAALPVSQDGVDGQVAATSKPPTLDPADLAAQQVMALQAMLAPQLAPVPSATASAASGDQPVVSNTVGADVAVLPPEITSGPWGQYQTPVMPDQRFVRFIMPRSDHAGFGPAASLLGPVILDKAEGIDQAVADMSSDQTDIQSVLAGLETAVSSSASSEQALTTAGSLGETLASKIAALTQIDSGPAASSSAGTSALLSDAETASPASTHHVAPSTASLFSSIFAKHGIDAPSVTGSVTDDFSYGATSSANRFSAQDFAALGLDPFSTDSEIFTEPTMGGTIPMAVSNPVIDGASDPIRAGLLKSLGALKTPQSKGGLASQLFNSKQILDLAAEEGLTLTTSAPALEQASGIVSADHAFMTFLDNALPDAHAQSHANAASADIGGSLLLRGSATGGQEQTGGQNHARQDGQPANQQQGNEALVSANGPLADDATLASHAATKADKDLLSGAEAHQTTAFSDASSSEISSFSTASMATSASGVTPSGGSLGAREALLSVTYAMTGRSLNGSGSAVASEMRFMSLGQQVMAALKQNSQEIELRLNPAQLGNVVLKLQVEGQKLSISARTESQLSDDALSAGEEGLRASLAANGYQLDKFDVSHQDERRKPQRSETEQSHGPEQKSDDPFSFDLIA